MIIQKELPKKVVAIHDLSCIGRCALSVVIPILSVLGYQVCPLPTALLSTQTDGFDDFTFLDLSDELPKIAGHWKELSFSFDAVYSGFLGSEKSISHIIDFVSFHKKQGNTLYLADPVMGENGQMYSTYTAQMCDMIKQLAKHADIITPNITEASLLLDIEYRESLTEAERKDLLIALSDLGCAKVVITGVFSFDESDENGVRQIGSAYFDKDTKSFGYYKTQCVNAFYPGTGDVFSSVLLGEYLSGKTLSESTRIANSFVYEAVTFTYNQNTPIREGLLIESLWNLLK